MLETQQLSKSYSYRGRVTEAVTDLSFSLARGQILGLLGPNGAGKSSTLRMLATVSRPTQGTAMVAGHDIVRDARRVRTSIGYVPQAGTLIGESVVGEEMIFHGQSFGMSAKEARDRGREILSLMGAERFMDKRAGRLSGGERRKIDIAMGMMNHPQVAFLDEPTVGLDPDARQALWELIRQFRERWNTTVVLTTHYLDEAESLADEIILLERGRVIAHDTTQKLKEQYSIDQVTIRVAPSTKALQLEEIESIPEVDNIALEPGGQDGSVLQLLMHHGSSVLPVVLAQLAQQEATISKIDIRKGGLNDAFFTLTGKEVAA